VVRSWVDQLRPLLIVGLLLTLPVVCHNETAVVILTAAAAGHEHQHMMAEAAGEPQPARAAHHHAAAHAHAASAPAASALALVHAGSPAPFPWRAYQATPLAQSLPAATDGIVLADTLDLTAPVALSSPLGGVDAAAPAPQRRAPPAPPPRAFLG